MRKMIVVCALIIASTYGAVAGPIIGINVWIGRGHIPECPGFGFCGVTVNAMNGNATIQLNDARTTLSMNLTTAAIKGKENYFKGTTVKLDDPFVLDADVTKALGLNARTTIQPGVYALKKISTGYQIIIPINK